MISDSRADGLSHGGSEVRGGRTGRTIWRVGCVTFYVRGRLVDTFTERRCLCHGVRPLNLICLSSVVSPAASLRMDSVGLDLKLTSLTASYVGIQVTTNKDVKFDLGIRAALLKLRH
ncbi:hypothetical protein BaRGS_00011004 [Batillaria attramentaria]|uniref:Uncharacterized protein n=1 Tax=Batillaria attramentaria TaxID=370345 RepID=A0ABD0LEH1_9CAEN